MRTQKITTLAAVAVAGLLAACGGADRTEVSTAAQSSAPAGGSDAPVLHLTVSNQSFDDPTVRITIEADGSAIVDDELDVEGQHTWVPYDVPLAAGTHELCLTADSGAVATHTVTLTDAAPVYVNVDHWTAQEPGDPPAFFTVRTSDEPFVFD